MKTDTIILTFHNPRTGRIYGNQVVDRKGWRFIEKLCRKRYPRLPVRLSFGKCMEEALREEAA